LPPIDKQNEIASHILEVRQKAKALQEEGKAILEEAKRKIETMIINVN
jgi:F0F1-type ATP synthase membrane subunit b/b'